MRKLVLFILLIGINFSCSTKNVIPELFQNVNSVGWKTKQGKLYFKDVPYNGKQYALLLNGDTAFIASYLDGKIEGIRRHWYSNGKLKEERFFVKGRQEGIQRGWYENGNKSFEYNFKNDIYEGSCYEWYEDGSLSKHFQYKAGQENGMQVWKNPDGSLRANYEVRNGKIYGNIGTKNCASSGKDM
jgi:antitoxin component YwqK of YwqJK toxin-antitoxin module